MGGSVSCPHSACRSSTLVCFKLAELDLSFLLQKLGLGVTAGKHTTVLPSKVKQETHQPADKTERYSLMLIGGLPIGTNTHLLKALSLCLPRLVLKPNNCGQRVLNSQ